MNLQTKLAIIGLRVMVLMLLGVAVLMLWRSWRLRPQWRRSRLAPRGGGDNR
jgi:hypothetical protein